MDYRLSRWKDDDGQVWQICQICTEVTRYEDLAIDKTDNLRWDICATCECKEFNYLARLLIEKLMPKIPSEYRAGFEGMMIGGEYAMAIEDLVVLAEDHDIELTSAETDKLRDLDERK
jgi:hypothetical protein